MDLSRKVAMVALGCPKNDVDGEIMLGQLRERNYEIVGDVAAAEVVLVNTCAFIKGAQEEAISAILEVARHKETGALRCLVVTGCLSERYKDEILNQMPEVDAVIGTGSIGETADIVDSLLDGVAENRVFCATPRGTEYLEQTRIHSETRPFRYLKIAEGCDNRCTYCVIPSLRGEFRSRPVELIVREAAELLSTQVKEFILVAQDVTRYGSDFAGTSQLVPLIRAISALPGSFGIRLLYCYPELVDDALITELRDNPKLIPYLDLPIQHISEPVLRRMGRRGSADDIRSLLKRLRAEVPGIVLRSTLITGFPGETEADFEALYQFVSEGPFEHLGVFDYSREDGTPAARMKGQVPVRQRRKRRDLLMTMQREQVKKWNISRVGETYDTIIEGVSEDGIFYLGRTAAEAPDIDPVLYVTSETPLHIGDQIQVRVLAINGYDLVGQAIPEQ